MNILIKTFLILGIVLSFPHIAFADSDAAKRAISGIIGFGLQQIEQELQNEASASNPTKQAVSNTNNQNALELGLGKDYANYFISKNFADEVAKGLALSNQVMPNEALQTLESLDIRGLKLMSTYEEALKFAAQEKSVCQSLLSNFHTPWHVMNFERKSSEHTIKASSDKKISQNVFYCKQGTVSNLSFTPLGRLDGALIVFTSEENNADILKTFEQKLSPKAIENKCSRRSGGRCEQGRYFYKDQYAEMVLRYEDKSTFKDGKYYYVYEMELNSKYLTRLDHSSMKKALTKDEPKTKTKL